MTISMTRRRAIAGIVAAFFGSLQPAHAGDLASAYVENITNEVIKLANSGIRGLALRAKFSALLNRYVNIRSIANFALGTYQKKIPPRDKDKFYQLVTNYASALFVYYVEDFEGTGLEIKETAKQGAFTTIQSAIKQKGGGRENVRWRLSGGNGAYRVADVNLKGIWMTISMKKRFTDVLNRSKGDFEPLYAELREAESW